MLKSLRSGIALLLVGVAIAASNADPPGHRPASPAEPPRLALPSETRGNVGYYLGGGNPFPHKAEPRGPEEGAWGWDYQGWLMPRRVINGWWHGRRYQGGTGAYKTDGPSLRP